MVERDVAELRARVAQLESAVAFLSRHLGVVIPTAAPSGVSARVLELVRAGNKLAAIKEYCAETGADLATAKRVVETLE